MPILQDPGHGHGEEGQPRAAAASSGAGYLHFRRLVPPPDPPSPQLSFLATSLALDSWTSLGASRSYSSLARPLQSPLQVNSFHC